LLILRASHSASTSLIATVEAVIHALIASLSELPSTPVPTYSTEEASSSRTGRARSRASPSPATSHTSFPDRAGAVLPETGASRYATPCSCKIGKSTGTLGSDGAGLYPDRALVQLG